MASSMTALGNRANALFSQIVAGLAYERMMRETVLLSGCSFQYLPSLSRDSAFLDHGPLPPA
jgi:hypothetical protein